MLQSFKLNSHQWKILSSAISNISQGVILFSLGTIFIPETLGLSTDFPYNRAIGFFFGGLIILVIGVILGRKVK